MVLNFDVYEKHQKSSKSNKKHVLLCTCLDNQSWRSKRDLNPCECDLLSVFETDPFSLLGTAPLQNELYHTNDFN